MPVVIEWDWIDLHLSVTIEKSSTIHGFYHFWISRGWKLKNFFELVWAFWVYLANRETTNTSHFSSGHVCFDICEPKKAQELWSIPKMTAQLLARKVSLPALTSILISVIVSTKEIVHYSINTHTFHMSFLFWSEISFHHPLTVEWDDFHSLREYIANVHRFREFLEDSRWQWE